MESIIVDGEIHEVLWWKLVYAIRKRHLKKLRVNCLNNFHFTFDVDHHYIILG